MKVQRAGVLLALVLYGILGVRFGQSFFAFAEETLVQPARAQIVLTASPDPTGAGAVGASGCRPGEVHTLWLPDRPRWSLCAGGRQWPIMLAGYLGGFLFWPFGVFGAAVGDDLMARRALSTAVGALALLLGARLARETEGAEAEAPAALALAATPAFVVVHAIFLHYETAPSTMLCLAALRYVGDLRRGALRARTCAWMGLLVGLSLSVNLRFFVVVIAIGLTAIRFRARWPGVGADELSLGALGFVVGLSPALACFSLDRTAHHGDRADLLVPALRQNLSDPWALPRAMYDVVRWWGNLADYLRDFNGPASFNVVSHALAAITLAWLLGAGLRALWRREGNPLLAVLSLTLLGFWAMGGLIYVNYPRNMAPLHAVFGLAFGVALHRIGQALARRGLREGARLAVCVALVAPFAVNVEQLCAASRRSPAPYNLASERAMAAHLRAHPLPGSTLLIYDFALSGVFEGLGGGGGRVAYFEKLFTTCPGRDTVCRVARARSLLTWAGDGPVRVMLLAPDPSLAPEDQGPTFDTLRTTLRKVGARVEDEFLARTPRGAEGILLMRVYRAEPPSAASTPPSQRDAISR
ncbi:MAG: hypothetical protein U0325_10345 [Polyangiales bacterium]